MWWPKINGLIRFRVNELNQRILIYCGKNENLWNFSVQKAVPFWSGAFLRQKSSATAVLLDIAPELAGRLSAGMWARSRSGDGPPHRTDVFTLGHLSVPPFAGNRHDALRRRPHPDGWGVSEHAQPADDLAPQQLAAPIASSIVHQPRAVCLEIDGEIAEMMPQGPETLDVGYALGLRPVVDVDPSPKFPPVKNRVLGCRQADRDGVSLFGRAAFLRPGHLRQCRRAQAGSSLAAGHRRSRRTAGLRQASTVAA